MYNDSAEGTARVFDWILLSLCSSACFVSMIGTTPYMLGMSDSAEVPGFPWRHCYRRVVMTSRRRTLSVPSADHTHGAADDSTPLFRWRRPEAGTRRWRRRTTYRNMSEWLRPYRPQLPAVLPVRVGGRGSFDFRRGVSRATSSWMRWRAAARRRPPRRLWRGWASARRLGVWSPRIRAARCWPSRHRRTLRRRRRRRLRKSATRRP